MSQYFLMILGTVSTAVLLFVVPIQGGAMEALPQLPPVPKNNPMTKEKIELGKMLYFEPRLSKSGTISCNSCHNVMAGGDDGRSVSVGIDGEKGGRSAPTVWNSAFLSVQFWDGRAASLEEQAKGPIENPVEMGATHKLVVDRILKIDEYKKLFAKVFGAKGAVNIENVAKAIAAYERTLITPNAPFDRYMKGDKKALSKLQIEGMKKFQEVGCVACHSGVNFAGPQMPEGSGFYMKFPTFAGSKYEERYGLKKDMGRYEVTKSDSDKNMWRVPTLRNVAVTAPYFHNGSVQELDEAIRVMAKTQVNRDLSSSEIKAIRAFLESLTGEFPRQTMPQLPLTVGYSQVGKE